MLRRAESLLILNGILAIAIGIVLATRNCQILLASSCIVLGFALFTGSMSKKIGFVLTIVSVIVFIIALFFK
jgi:hypothetical protein